MLLGCCAGAAVRGDWGAIGRAYGRAGGLARGVTVVPPPGAGPTRRRDGDGVADGANWEGGAGGGEAGGGGGDYDGDGVPDGADFDA